MAPPVDHERLGIVCMLVSAALFSVTNVLIKQLSGTYPTTEVMFFRNVFALPGAFLLVLHAGGPHLLKTGNAGGHVLRAALGLVAMGLIFYSLKVLPVADAVAIYFGTPLLIMVLSGPLLGERQTLAQWMAAGVGLAGVLLIVRPGSGTIQLGALAALGSCFLYAAVSLLLRKLSRTESTATIAFYYPLICTAAMALVLPFGWETPTPGDLVLFVLLGICGSGAQYLLTHAFRNAPASVVAPFDYSQLLWSALFAWMLFAEVPPAATWAGAALIVGSGLYLLKRSRG
jgi:drug/metabolite transporter (DMT)-like permease